MQACYYLESKKQNKKLNVLNTALNRGLISPKGRTQKKILQGFNCIFLLLNPNYKLSLEWLLVLNVILIRPQFKSEFKSPACLGGINQRKRTQPL
jgi:hypothetical protein